jgi:large subunit ribosomal protein L18
MKTISRARRHTRITRNLKGTSDKPRLVIFRSNKHISAQLIDDAAQKTLLSFSTLSKEFTLKPTSNKTAAKAAGKIIAEKALKLGIKNICFDRAGYLYHGRVKEFAQGAREGGLKF